MHKLYLYLIGKSSRFNKPISRWRAILAFAISPLYFYLGIALGNLHHLNLYAIAQYVVAILTSIPFYIEYFYNHKNE